MFHVGQLVVCVDERQGVIPEPTPLAGLRKRAVYTVRTFTQGHVFREGVADAVWLEEVSRPRDRPFAAWRFRPVDETKLSIFREMLVTPPKEPALID